jgi:hypothetical protein
MDLRLMVLLSVFQISNAQELNVQELTSSNSVEEVTT